jgi:hypothetical protein
VPDGPQFQVNTYTPNRQDFPKLAMSPGGEFVVTWRSEGSPGPDQSGDSVQAARFQAVLFADGFESGDTSGWSQTTP